MPAREGNEIRLRISYLLVNDLLSARDSRAPVSPTFDAPGLPRIGIIIPACNEEACISEVLRELLAVIDPAKYKLLRLA